MDKRQQNDITLITESGYLMLVKSFTDDLAWTVQRALIKTYFKAQELTVSNTKLLGEITDNQNFMLIKSEIAERLIFRHLA